MSKQKNRRVGQGMKNRVSQIASANEGQSKVENEVKTDPKTAAPGGEKTAASGGTLEPPPASQPPAPVQNLESGSEPPAATESQAPPAAIDETVAHPPENQGQNDPERESAGARLAEMLSRSAQEAAITATPSAEDLDAVAEEEQIRELTHSDTTVGPREDGTFGIVVSIAEGYMEGIRQQAASDRMTPEAWVTQRLEEYLETWWSPPRGR